MTAVHFGQLVQTSDGLAHPVAICGRWKVPRTSEALGDVTCKICLRSNGLVHAQQRNAQLRAALSPDTGSAPPSTVSENDYMASRHQPCADASALARTPSGNWTYRGWLISLEPDNQWHAISPDYDASYEGPEDGWVDNGEKVEAATLDGVCGEIDFWIKEHS